MHSTGVLHTTVVLPNLQSMMAKNNLDRRKDAEVMDGLGRRSILAEVMVALKDQLPNTRTLTYRRQKRISKN